jgi:hypothetical protein
MKNSATLHGIKDNFTKFSFMAPAKIIQKSLLALKFFCTFLSYVSAFTFCLHLGISRRVAIVKPGIPWGLIRIKTFILLKH